MFVLGVAVMFSGVLRRRSRQAERPTLLTFVLPACTPPGPIDERLMGWAIALCGVRARRTVPAATAPPRRAAQACGQRGHRIGRPPRGQGHRQRSGGRDAGPAGELPRRGLPSGRAVRGQPRPCAGGRRLEWLADRVTDQAGPALRDMQAPGIRVLRCAAAVLRETRSADRTNDRADLEAALIHLRSVARGRYRQDVERILAAPDDAAAVTIGRALLNRRTMAATIGATGRVIAAAAADARPVWARALGLRLPPTTATDRLIPETAAVRRRRRGSSVAGRWPCATRCAPASGLRSRSR